MYEVIRLKVASDAPSPLQEKTKKDLQELFKNSQCKNPFYHPALIESALKHLINKPSSLTLGYKDGSVVACIPIIKKPFKKIPFICHSLTHQHCFLHSPHYSDAEALKLCLAETLNKAPFGILIFPTINMDSIFVRDITRKDRDFPWTVFCFNQHARAGFVTSNSSSKEVSSKSFKKLEKKRRKMGINSKAQAEPGSSLKQVETFLSLEHSGWKKANKSSLRSSESEELYFREILGTDSIVPHMWHTLSNSQMTVATTCTLLHNGSGYRFKTTFNEEFKSFSPGAILEMDVFTQLKSSLNLIDGCCTPQSENMNRTYPDKLAMSSLILVRNDQLSGRTVNGLLSLCDRSSKLLKLP